MKAIRKPCLLAGLGAVLAFAPSADALQLDYTLKASVTGEANGGRDANLRNAPDDQQAYLDLTPWVHAQFSPAWAAFLRVRAFAPTGSVLASGNDSNNAGVNSKAYIGLREAWIDYRGLTSYPGESLRLGRQRIRNPDAQWFDQDIDALRWNFDTTLLKADIGIGHQFSSYRSDGLAVTADQRDRSYVFGSLATEWRPENVIGLRVVHAEDDHDSPAVGSAVDRDTKRTSGSPTWINVFADNNAYDDRSLEPLHYWAQGTVLLGHAQRSSVDPAGTTVTAVDGGRVTAGAGELGLRYRVSDRIPVQLGAALVYSTGDAGADGTSQYAQTGLQSNYSRFTGTRTLINRYNDAYRAQLGNLIVGTAFVSLAQGPYDTSIVYSQFKRAASGGRVQADGLTVAPVNDSRSLGYGYEFVATRYFGAHATESKLAPQEDFETSLRLRAALFDPGAAYGPAADLEYRVTLEFTLWY